MRRDDQGHDALRHYAIHKGLKRCLSPKEGTRKSLKLCLSFTPDGVGLGAVPPAGRQPGGGSEVMYC